MAPRNSWWVGGWVYVVRGALQARVWRGGAGLRWWCQRRRTSTKDALEIFAWPSFSLFSVFSGVRRAGRHSASAAAARRLVVVVACYRFVIDRCYRPTRMRAGIYLLYLPRVCVSVFFFFKSVCGSFDAPPRRRTHVAALGYVWSV